MKSALSDFIFGKKGDLWYSSHYYISNVLIPGYQYLGGYF